MKKRFPPLIAIAILLYTAWNASDILSGWQSSPFQRFAPLACIIWVSPIFLYWFGGPFLQSNQEFDNRIILALALTVSLVGTLGSVHILQHAGFVLALASLIPWSLRSVIWIGCAISWLPALGWIAQHHNPDNLAFLRVFLATTVALWIILDMRLKKQ